jgi:cytidylate kinase
MNVITLSREYGAGGEEVAQGLARALGWQILDRELLHDAAQIANVPESDIERLDEQPAAKGERLSSSLVHQQYIRALTEAATQAARRGGVILIGRGGRHLLGEMGGAFHLRLIAPKAWRALRVARQEGLSAEQATARCAEVDSLRRQFTHFYFGDASIQPAEYDLVANTGRVMPEDVVAVVAAIVRRPAQMPAPEARGRRVLTLARELGAGDADFASVLGQRLGLTVWDRELLDLEASRMGIPRSEVERLDEQPVAGLGDIPATGIQRRYFESLGQIMKELADQGEALLVGRGGSCFLRDHPWAFHVKLVAPITARKRKVSEHRFLREDHMRRMIAESDNQQRDFYQTYFKTDWSSPLEFDISVNCGRLGPAAVDLVALAAQCHWQRLQRAAGGA